MTLEKNIENIEKYEGFVKSFVQETYHKDLILETFTKNKSKNKKSHSLNNISFAVKDIINVDGLSLIHI